MSLFLEWGPLALATVGFARSIDEAWRRARNPLPWAIPVIAVAMALGLWRAIADGDAVTIVVYSLLTPATALVGVRRAVEYREART